ncbi:guanine nucleotide-binding protein g(o) subunit alpha [Anaeramoeba flamelloides]|uniref:Guanine nucleotide-binding protein g(O) subunit alpha n=1 Tax=Anaeramoeba flamelloides TaxID=1746091 RepID=A0ABQ8Y8A1_9EUKA|nr:guanine nucleotide-binding protein g(o) subunit alpha [Anaeramoeba flamelloides]
MGNKQARRRKKTLKAQSKKNKQINRSIKGDRENEANTTSTLILGTGDSGKSTLIKQIQILYKDGFSEFEIQKYQKAICVNIKNNTKKILNFCNMNGIDLLKKNRRISENFLSNLDVLNDSLTTEIVQNIQSLWKDPGLKLAYSRRNEFVLPDSANYFFDRVGEIGKSDYEPSNFDILNCRIPTVGVRELNFSIKNEEWRIVDVGGQRSERRKWIHHFQDVDLLFFVVAISEYNQKLFEDERINRLRESLTVFTKTLNNEFLQKKDCVLLLNKIDLFKEKLDNFPLSKYFNEFTGENNFEESSEFLKKLFINSAPKNINSIVSHFTCGTDTNNIKEILSFIQNKTNEKNISDEF